MSKIHLDCNHLNYHQDRDLDEPLCKDCFVKIMTEEFFDLSQKKLNLSDQEKDTEFRLKHYPVNLTDMVRLWLMLLINIEDLFYPAPNGRKIIQINHLRNLISETCDEFQKEIVGQRPSKIIDLPSDEIEDLDLNNHKKVH